METGQGGGVNSIACGTFLYGRGKLCEGKMGHGIILWIFIYGVVKKQGKKDGRKSNDVFFYRF